MNKNRGLTPLAAVLMLSGSLVLTGCNDKETQQQGAHQQAPEVGVVTLKAEPLNITTDLLAVPLRIVSPKFALRSAASS